VLYDVVRFCDVGRLVPVHLRRANSTRGRLFIRQERDASRNRTLLIARVEGPAGAADVLPLHDVVLVGMVGDGWLLTGTERIPVGPLGVETWVGQTWWAEPAPLQDLIDLEAKWAAANAELVTLRAIREAKGVG